MGSSSVSTQRRFVQWQGLLLVVSLLNFCSQHATTQVTVQTNNALEGTDVLLRLLNKPADAVGFLWYRGETTDSHHNIAYLLVNPRIHIKGPPGGQAIVDDDGHLLLKNVTMKHSGIYTVLVQLQGCQQMIGRGQLNVYPRVMEPSLLITQNEDSLVLSCDANNHTIQWLFNDKNLMITDRMTLSHDNRNLTIYSVRRQEAGKYECKAFNPVDSAISKFVKLILPFQ